MLRSKYQVTAFALFISAFCSVSAVQAQVEAEPTPKPVHHCGRAGCDWDGLPEAQLDVSAQPLALPTTKQMMKFSAARTTANELAQVQ